MLSTDTCTNQQFFFLYMTLIQSPNEVNNKNNLGQLCSYFLPVHFTMYNSIFKNVYTCQ